MLHNRNEMVSALTTDGHVLQVGFNKPYTGTIDKSMVSVFASKSLARVGVESVELASNGLTAEIVFYDNTSDEAKPEIDYLINYTMKIGSLSFDFARPAYKDSDDGAYVTAVDADEREIKVLGNTLTVPESMKMDFQQILGQDVRVWWDADKVVVDYEIESEAIYEAFEFTELDELETIDEEAEYDLAKDADGDVITKLVVNDSSKSIVKGAKYDYAKIVLNDDGEVARIYATDLTATPILVEKTEDEVIVDYDGAELDLEDYIIVKDGMQIDIDDIKEGDLVFFNKDVNDKDGLAVVYNNTITGEIDHVFTSSFDLDGENYEYNLGVAEYINEDGERNPFDDDGAEKLQEGGEVKVYFNHQNEIMVVKGSEGDVASEYDVMFTTDFATAYSDVRGNQNVELSLVNKDGDEKVYDFDINDIDEILVQTNLDELSYEVDENTPTGTTFEIDEFVINSISPSTGDTDGFVIEAVDKAGVAANATVVSVSNARQPIGVAVDDEGDIIGLKFFDASSEMAITSAIDTDDSYAKNATQSKRMLDSTLVYNLDTSNVDTYPDADEVTVSTWADLQEAGTDIEVGAGIDATRVFFDEDGDVTHIITANLEAANTTNFTALITRVDVNTDNEIVRIKALVNGNEVSYDVDNLASADLATMTVSQLVEGSLAVLEVNDSTGEVTDIWLASDTSNDPGAQNRYVAPAVIAANGVNVSDKKITLDGTNWYTLGSKGKVYEALTGKDGDDFTVKSVRDLKPGDTVELILSAENTLYVDAIVRTAKVVVAGPVVPTPVAVEAPDAVSVLGTDVTDGFLNAAEVVNSQVVRVTLDSTHIAGQAVRVYLGSATPVAAIALASGDVALGYVDITVPASAFAALADGPVVVTAKVRNAAGLESLATVATPAFAKDVVVAAPTGVTAPAGLMTIVGAAASVEAGSTVRVYDAAAAGNLVAGTAVVNADGSFTWTADAALNISTAYFVEVTDAAGNVSATRTSVTTPAL